MSFDWLDAVDWMTLARIGGIALAMLLILKGSTHLWRTVPLSTRRYRLVLTILSRKRPQKEPF